MRSRPAAAAAACLALARAPGALAEGCASVTCSSITDSSTRGTRKSTGTGDSLRCFWGTKPLYYECPDLPEPRPQGSKSLSEVPCFFDTGTVSVSCVCQDKSEAEERVKGEAEPWLYLSIALTVLGGFVVSVMRTIETTGFLTSTSLLETYYLPQSVGSSREPEVVEAEVVGEANPNLVADLEANPNLVAGGAKNPPAPSSKVQAEDCHPNWTTGIYVADRVEMVVGLLLLSVPPLLVCSWAYAVSKSEDGITGSFGFFIVFATIVVYVLHSANAVRWMLGQFGLLLSIRRVWNNPVVVAGLVLGRTAVCVLVPGVAGMAWALRRMNDAEGFIDPDRLC